MPEDRPVYYPDYLALEQLLTSQHLESAKHGPPAHDEMLFIIVHQAYELWFKQILWELDAVLGFFSGSSVDESDVGRSVSHLGRIVEIQRVLLDQINILETMTPLDFLDFREFLVPASGFQSAQFRLIENKLGLRRVDREKVSSFSYLSRFSPPDRDRLVAAEEAPTLFDLIERWLERTPFLRFGVFDFWQEYRQAVEAMLENDQRLMEENPALSETEKAMHRRAFADTAANFEALFDPARHSRLVEDGNLRLSHQALKAALLIHLYRDEPILHLPFRVLRLMVDIDENFTTWRYRHSLMALRMIGSKIGTGGSSGHEYLRRAAEHSRIFTDLTGLATFFIPRSDLPALPPEIEQSMGFRFEAD